MTLPDSVRSLIGSSCNEQKSPIRSSQMQRSEQEAETPDQIKQSVRGRKRKTFEEKKSRSQMQESKDLRDKHSPGLIHMASQQNLKISGKKDAAFVVKRISSETGRTAKFARAAILSKNGVRPFKKKTPEEALFFLLTNNLTKDQYTNMKQACKKSGADIWPGYSYVQGAKAGLEPDEIEIKENVAQVPLQEVLNHTVKRIFQCCTSLEQEMEEIAETNGNKLEVTLYYKLGFDSSGSHTITQQTNSEGDHREVKSIMASQMCPIKLSAFVDDEEITLFDYPGTNSPHSCRPLRLSFEKENKETIEQEFQRLKKEMDELENFIVCESPSVQIKFSGLFTMIDGKVLCAITGSKTTECPLCHESGAELAKNEGSFEVKSSEFLNYGASPLHFGLRAFRTLLNIGYKQDFKTH
jgi:hypothetical protein